APARDSPTTARTAGTFARSSKRTAKPSRMALSKGGESASRKTSSRRIRCMQSVNDTDSAAIQSARSFDCAVVMTISSPRSIGSILEQLSRLRYMESEVVTVNLEIYRPSVVHLESERGAAFRDAYVVLRQINSEFFCF